ncbi:hypothetical protein V6N13_065206 [Hibiscus sabdariffa]|uniref:Uncharacterized protein n=1 Tax=Hibiscus sabdariffa TaxID=183260 RepID=A0ABR2QRI8_9ROSI
MEAMKKSFLLVYLFSALLVFASAQVNVFPPFDFESEFSQDSDASTFSRESQYFPQSNPDEPSLLSQSEFPQDSMKTKYFPNSNDEGISSFSESGRPYDSLESQSVSKSNAKGISSFSESERPYDSLETQSVSKSNAKDISSFSESDRPYDSLESQSVPNSNAEESSLFSEFEHPFDSLETQNFPVETSQFSETGFSKEFDYPGQSFEIQAPSKTKPPPPSPAPSPPEVPAPSPSETPAPSPSPPKNTCKHKCLTKCNNFKFPILRRLCVHVCERKCLLSYSVQIYNCTAVCAQSMPNIFKSDKKKAAGYVNYCYTKCIKKF